MSTILALITVLLGQSGLPDATSAELREQVKELRQDIVIINLLNGLSLSRNQMERLLVIAKKASGPEAASQTPETAEVLNEARDAFTALRTEIQKGMPAQGEIPERAERAKQRVKQLNKHLLNQDSREMDRLQDEIRNVLTPGQLYLVERYQPCLIPADDISNPASYGQAEASQKVIGHLRRLRDLPEPVWNWRQEAIVRRVVGRLEEQVRLTDEERSSERERVSRLLKRVRALSDIDFEMEKTSLAKQLKPRIRIDELRDKFLWRLPHAKHRGSRLQRFFLNERIIPILAERLGQ
jgi:hypothetical protein